MYTATITVTGNTKLIDSCFQPEEKQIGKRSAYTVERKGSNVLFTVTAKDSVALRAHLNSITKMLTVIEDMESI